MKRGKATLLVFYFIVQAVISSRGMVHDKYNNYPNKRLKNNVIKAVKTSSAFHCITWCSMTDGCLAVNVIGNHDITCELTAGLSNGNEMEDDSSSELHVLDYDKCAEEPGFCRNGAACERTWTSTRCHCADRYQGDRCDECTERFQGDGCQECAENYYGDDCEVFFTSLLNTGCTAATVGTPHDYPANFENCKEECAGRDDCGGVFIYSVKCYLKDTSCEDNKNFQLAAVLFVKKVN